MECGIEGCSKPVYSTKTGWCRSHHVSWFRHGDPLAGLEARFWAKVDRSGGQDACWPWTGPTAGRQRDYGVITIDGRTRYAHRTAYELAIGELPSELQVDHTCWNHLCCNPMHLRAVTHKQNQENRKRGRGELRGVHFDKRRNTWHARVSHNGKMIHLGRFANAKEAAEAARLKRLELFTHNEVDRK